MSFAALAWAAKVKTGSPTTKAVLMAIAECVNGDGVGFHGQETIAEQAEISVRSVARAMDQLEKLGLMTRTRRYREGGYRTSDLIELHIGKQPEILHAKLSNDTQSNLTGQSVVAEPVCEPVSSIDVAPAPVPDDVQVCVDLWNEFASTHGLSKAQVVTAARRKHFKVRLSECGGVDGWKHLLSVVADSPHLLGKSKPKPGTSAWRCSLDWLIESPGNFTKAMEGQYVDKSFSQPKKSDTQQKQQDYHDEVSDLFGDIRSSIASSTGQAG